MIVTLIAVCDGAEAKVFRHQSNKRNSIDFVQSFSGSHFLDQNIVSDRPGRSLDSYGFNRHSYVDPTDPHEYKKKEFIGDVLSWIAKGAEKKEFDRIIMIAPPHVLGLLRKSYTQSIERLLSEEIGKDLVHAPTEQIIRKTKSILAPNLPSLPSLSR